MEVSDRGKSPAMVAGGDWQRASFLAEGFILDLQRFSRPILVIFGYVGCLGVAHLVVGFDHRQNDRQSAGGDGKKTLLCWLKINF